MDKNEPESVPSDDEPAPNTSMEMTTPNITSDEEFKFDINGNRYIPYSDMKHPKPPTKKTIFHHMFLDQKHSYLWGCGMIQLKTHV